MLVTIKEIINRLKSASSPQAIHDLSMNLVESHLRHLAVVFLAVYRHCGCRDAGVNREIYQQLPWPSMGTWQGIVRRMVKLDAGNFPDKFHAAFAKPLTQRKKGLTKLASAYAHAQAMIRFGHSPESVSFTEIKPKACTPLELFDTLVTYRNDYIGHSTYDLKKECLDFAPVLRDGILELAQDLRPLWIACPIYHVTATQNRAGKDVQSLTPLVQDQAITDRELPADPDTVETGRLQVQIGRDSRTPISLYPIALWHDDDILFLNGSRNFREIKFVGFTSNRKLSTDRYEDDFSDFIRSFLVGASTPSSFDLGDAQAVAQAAMLEQSGWRFPRLRSGLEFGAKGSRYRLLGQEPLGVGGMAVVWKAESLATGEQVAVKFLSNIGNFARFRREARALRKFSRQSDRFVRYLDFQFDDHPNLMVAFLVMELLPGKSLADILKEPADSRDDRFYRDVLGWMEDTLEALKLCHQQGLLHRDIKPSNLMFDAAERRVKLGDLGLIGVIGGGANDLLTTTGLTRQGAPIGTFEYASLEQLRGGSDGTPVTERSDLFSVGAAFYHVITGKSPYGSGELSGPLSQQMLALSDETKRPVPPHKLGRQCPFALSRLTSVMINVDPDHRHESAEAVLHDVREARLQEDDEDTNQRFGLFGETVALNKDIADLLPRWLSRYVFIVFPTVYIAIGILVLALLSSQFGFPPHIDVTQIEVGPLGAYEIEYQLSDDYVSVTGFFQTLLLLGLLYRARKRVRPLLEKIHSLDMDGMGAHWDRCVDYNNWWSRVIASRRVLLLLILIGVGVHCVQTFRLDQLAAAGKLYWYDWRISEPIFYLIRFRNFMTASTDLLIVAVSAALIHVLCIVLRGMRADVDPGNSDGSCGLSAMGQVVTLFVPVFLVGAVFAMVGTMTHQTGWQLAIDWIGLTFLSGVYIFLIVFTLRPVRMGVRKFLNREVELLVNRRRVVDGKVRGYLRAETNLGSEKARYYVDLRDLSEKLVSSEQALAMQWTWPIKKRTLSVLILIGLLPIGGAVAGLVLGG